MLLLIDADLIGVQLGLQSGSERIARDLFRRPERVGEFIEAARILDEFAPRLWARTYGGASYDDVRPVAVGLDDAIRVTGAFYGPADFDPGPGQDVRLNLGLYDAYLVVLSATGGYLGASTWGAPASGAASQSMVSGVGLTVAAD